jgi:type I restriction enzyme R subunit
MTSNFEYIKEQFPDVFAAAQEAEENAYRKPITSAIYSRQAMELLINWVYQVDHEYEIPYQNTLVAKIRGDAFTRDVPPSIIRELDFVRKTGNNAIHARKASPDAVMASLKYLFHWTQYATRLYTELEHPRTFDETLIPKKKSVKESIIEVTGLRDKLKKEIENQKALERKVEENDQLKSKLDNLQAELAKIKQANKHIPIPEPDISEDKTRKLFIDADLIAAGWDLDQPNVQEYEVFNMPKSVNPSGKGYIDYVLWDDDGLPLAVVEAKRMSVSVKKGKNQAEIYANCLEKIFGRRPIIFYTNGKITYIWDDEFGTPRLIYGMYTKKELQRLISRRTLRKDIRKEKIDLDIADRYYQDLAFKRVTEAFVMSDPISNKLVQNKRKALLVMATGTGKTRTVIAIVKMMMKSNWAKKVLFLADRKALVAQAKKNFNSLVPEFTSRNISKEADDENSQLVFSTYNTMINRIDDGKQKDGIAYGIGHFDLIIIDEAHRSIYSKYQDIFNYFDGLMIGLTATPREDSDHQTYDFFGCEDKNPTYYYELDTAVNDKWLTPPKKMQSTTKFLQRGLKYSDLDDAEKEKFELAFAKYGEEIPDEINAAAINRWLFNEDTVVKVLDNLMENGLKVQSGDVIGKTIIFATNQKHAEFIQEVFDRQYPKYKGKLTKVITHDDKYAQQSIDDFEIEEKNPRIAISVDMLDTGIDVPSILNLVFFKPVYSRTKFWQMIGRGTRLREDLFGPGEHKSEFYIFDCCSNFEYFDMNPEGRTGISQLSLSHRIFEMRILLAEALKGDKYIDEDFVKMRNALLSISHQHIVALYDARETKFSVRLRIGTIEKFSHEEIWQDLNSDLVNEITTSAGPIVQLDDEDEKAKLFDLLLYKMELAYLQGDPSFEKGKVNIIKRAEALQKKANVNVIKDKLPLISRIQSDAFWADISLPSLEFIRIQLRELMKLLVGKEQPLVHINIEDTANFSSIASDVKLPTTPQNYLDRVKSYIRNNSDHLVINKIIKNQQITKAELDKLEEILFDGDDRGTKADFVSATDTDKPLGSFIRSILGLDRKAALEAFSEFTNKGNLTANQQTFIESIINHFENEGVIDPGQLYDSPYDQFHMEGVQGVFNDEDTSMIISIVRSINEGAVGA